MRTSRKKRDCGMNHFDNFFKNKKILVTGHTGFKGSWLCTWLSALGAEVTGFSLKPNTQPNMFSVCDIDEDIVSLIADIRNYSAIEKAVVDNEPEIIFHLAAQPLVLESYSYPLDTFQTNILGTANLLEAVRLRGTDFVKSVVIVTSDKCYENNNSGIPFVENDKLGGKDPYSSSKASAEIITNAYYESYFRKEGKISVSTVRAGNVIGGGDWSADRLVPDCVRALSANDVISIRNPGSTRPWQHVIDPISGYIELAKQSYFNSSLSGAWNFGPLDSSVKTVSDLVNEVCNHWPSSQSTVSFSEKSSSEKEANLLSLNSMKSIENLNWAPKLNFQESVDFTIDWYKLYYSNPDSLKSLTLKQIKSIYG